MNRIIEFTVFAAVLLLATRLVVNWRTLNVVPGPFLAGLSDVWRFYYQYNGKLRGRLLALHKKHGPLVRYGVRSISIDDPSAIDIIYGSRAGFTTADSYNVLVGISNGKEVASLVSTQDEARHGAMRRSVASAFTPAAVATYEPYTDETILDLIDVLSKKTTFNCPETMLFASIDAASRISFSESLGCLRSDSDVGGVIAVIRSRMLHWGHWSSLPGLERVLYRNALAMRQKRAPSSMAAAAVAKLQHRRATAGTTSATGTTMHNDLLQRFLNASVARPDLLDTPGVVGMLMSTISGAGDTTATSMTAIVYNLLTHPTELATLLQELRHAGLDTLPLPPAHAQTKDLPFLNAVIKESMRVFTQITWPLERKVPAGGASIAGTFFPQGTSVGVFAPAVHMRRDVFGDDAAVFRPARWTEAGKEELRRMEMAHMGFSRGRRVCLGQHIAVMQMKKVIPTMFLKFKMSLVDPDAVLGADMSSAVAGLYPLYVRIDEILR